MNAGPTAARDAIAALQAVYDAKSAEEIRAAHAMLPGADAVADIGVPGATVMLVKGSPGPAESSGLPALSGPDGEAARLALEALGFDPESVYATVSRPVSRDGAIDSVLEARRLRALVEACDPRVVVALDPVAAQDLAAAFEGFDPAPGVVVRVGGRQLLALDGLEASLADPALKRRVWARLQALKPAPPLW